MTSGRSLPTKRCFTSSDRRDASASFVRPPVATDGVLARSWPRIRATPLRSSVGLAPTTALTIRAESLTRGVGAERHGRGRGHRPARRREKHGRDETGRDGCGLLMSAAPCPAASAGLCRAGESGGDRHAGARSAGTDRRNGVPEHTVAHVRPEVGAARDVAWTPGLLGPHETSVTGRGESFVCRRVMSVRLRSRRAETNNRRRAGAPSAFAARIRRRTADAEWR